MKALKTVFLCFCAVLAVFAAPAQASTLVLNGDDVMLLDDYGGWHDLSNAAYNQYDYPAQAAPVYDYHTDGDPADYEGRPYQNFRGYNNSSGYSGPQHVYSRPGYLGGYFY